MFHISLPSLLIANCRSVSSTHSVAASGLPTHAHRALPNAGGGRAARRGNGDVRHHLEFFQGAFVAVAAVVSPCRRRYFSCRGTGRLVTHAIPIVGPARARICKERCHAAGQRGVSGVHHTIPIAANTPRRWRQEVFQNGHSRELARRLPASAVR